MNWAKKRDSNSKVGPEYTGRKTDIINCSFDARRKAGSFTQRNFKNAKWEMRRKLSRVGTGKRPERKSSGDKCVRSRKETNRCMCTVFTIKLLDKWNRVV